MHCDLQFLQFSMEKMNHDVIFDNCLSAPLEMNRILYCTKHIDIKRCSFIEDAIWNHNILIIIQKKDKKNIYNLRMNGYQCHENIFYKRLSKLKENLKIKLNSKYPSKLLKCFIFTSFILRNNLWSIYHWIQCDKISIWILLWLRTSK